MKVKSNRKQKILCSFKTDQQQQTKEEVEISTIYFPPQEPIFIPKFPHRNLHNQPFYIPKSQKINTIFCKSKLFTIPIQQRFHGDIQIKLLKNKFNNQSQDTVRCTHHKQHNLPNLHSALDIHNSLNYSSDIETQKPNTDKQLMLQTFGFKKPVITKFPGNIFINDVRRARKLFNSSLHI